MEKFGIEKRITERERERERERELRGQQIDKNNTEREIEIN